MGCTQSTERKPTQQQQQQQESKARTEPVASPVKAETVVESMPPKIAEEPIVPVEQPAEEPKEVAAEPAVEEKETAPEAEETIAEEPKASEPAPAVVEPTEPVKEVTATVEAEPTQAVEPTKVPIMTPITIAPIAIEKATTETPVKVVQSTHYDVTSPITLLAIPQQKKATKKAAKKSPRAGTKSTKVANDENAGSPSLAPSAVKKAFGVSTGSNVVTSKKSVGFDQVPAPQTAAVKQAKAKAKARKHAGKRGANIDHDVLTQQIAAFERQLTHRSALDAHLSTR